MRKKRVVTKLRNWNKVKWKIKKVLCKSDFKERVEDQLSFSIYFQGQKGMHKISSAEVFLGKGCSENVHQIYMRIALPKSDFNKVALQLCWNRTSAWLLSCKFAAVFYEFLNFFWTVFNSEVVKVVPS